MRMDLLYCNVNRFSSVVTNVQRMLIEMKRRANPFERDCLTYIINRLTEIKCQMRFSRLLFDTGVRNVVVNDVDKVVRVGDEFKAIFELKVRRRKERYIKVNASQLTTYKYMVEKLGIPVYYLIFLPNNRFQLIKIDYWSDYDIVETNTYVKHLNDRFAVIPVEDSEVYDRELLVMELQDILGWW